MSRQAEALEIDMEYSTIAGTPLRVSPVAIGTWAIGGWMWGGTDEAESIATIRAALDHGINVIDTAPVYGFGRSEEIVGKAIAEGRVRDRVRLRPRSGSNGRTATCFAMLAATASTGRSRIPCDGCEPITSTSIRSIGPIPSSRSKRPRRRCKRCSSRERSAPSASAIFRSSRWSGFAAWRRCMCCSRPIICSSARSRPSVLPYCRKNNISTFGYGALCRGLLSGRMKPDTVFSGDDLRRDRSKIPATPVRAISRGGAKARPARAEALRQTRHSTGGPLDARSSVSLGALGRAPSGSAAAGRRGHGLAARCARPRPRSTGSCAETITDPVGPEFMAPPARAS